jgi:type IV secretory pathway TraG/TraD family ATPase VirD4
VAHGEAQLRSRWGANGAQVILDTSGTKIWLPGISDTATLNAASELCGTTAMKEVHEWFGPHRDDPDYYTRHPVMTPEMIRQLPPRRALVIRGGGSPVIAKLPMAWNDPAYRAAQHQQQTLIAADADRELDADGQVKPWLSGRWSAWDSEGTLGLPADRRPADPPGTTP